VSDVDVAPSLAAWLTDALGDPGPFALRRLTGGNSNETLLLTSPAARRVLRRPPAAAIGPGAHAVGREHRVLAALAGVGAPVPRPLAVREGDAPCLVMEHVDGAAIVDALPPGFPPPAAAAQAIGAAVIDAFAAVHRVDPVAAGLDGLGHPEGFRARQPERWRGQFHRHGVRALPIVDELADALAATTPPEAAPGVVHGDAHLDNVLVRPDGSVAAIVDWEMATVGDPALDLGLLLALWGDDRAPDPAVAHLQAVSRVPGAPTREALASRWADATGRSAGHLPWLMACALLKLGAVIEGAWAQHVAGRLDTPYARSLEHEVPRLFAEAAWHVGRISSG
jgi:aminoglycoside phosphotransferase (APT) family kinase protein